MPHRLHFQRHQVIWAITPLLYHAVEAQPNGLRLNHSPEPREWCLHRRRQQCRGHRSFGTDRGRFASVAAICHLYLVNCKTYFLVLTSLVLQTVDRVIPQAFPGTAFHGRSPVWHQMGLFRSIAVAGRQRAKMAVLSSLYVFLVHKLNDQNHQKLVDSFHFHSLPVAFQSP